MIIWWIVWVGYDEDQLAADSFAVFSSARYYWSQRFDWKFCFYFQSKDIEELDDEFYYCNRFGINEAARAQINASRDAKQEVFQTYRNGIEYRPKETVFVQTDDRNFTISIIAAADVSAFPLYWRFLCENYQNVLLLIEKPKASAK